MSGPTHAGSQPKSGLPIQFGLWDILTGLPAGVLIFMASVLFSTLTSLGANPPVFVPLLILMGVTLVVGVLAGMTRLRRGPATAMVAGCVAAGILGYLWWAARPGDQFNPLVIGLPGMLASLIVSPIGGWLGARLRKAL